MTIPFDPAIHLRQSSSESAGFQTILRRLHQKVSHDQVVQSTTDGLRKFLQVDRVVLYYFYREWAGQVTFESISDRQYSIVGMSGPDQCFNGEYAALYLDQRVRAIADIETEAIEDCHRDFLRHLQVKANLVVPILVEKTSEQQAEKRLWGLLVAHHCESPRAWTDSEIEQMKQGALVLASASSIKG